MKQIFRSSILSGIAVGIAGWGYLAKNDIVGAVLFSFGLLTVVNYKLKLYTGTAGFVELRYEDGSSRWLKAIGELLFILAGNTAHLNSFLRSLRFCTIDIKCYLLTYHHLR